MNPTYLDVLLIERMLLLAVVAGLYFGAGL